MTERLFIDYETLKIALSSDDGLTVLVGLEAIDPTEENPAGGNDEVRTSY